MAWVFPETEFASVLNHEIAERLVGTSVTSTQFLEGGIARGDQIKVFRPAAVSVSDYDPGADLTFTRISGSTSTLTIEKDKGFGNSLDNFDAHASTADLAAGIIREAGRALSNAADQYILSASAANGASGNTITVSLIASGSTAGATIAGYVRQAALKLSENDVPYDDRFIVMPPAAVQYLNDYIADRDTVLGDVLLERGYVGMFNGFQVYESNHLPTNRMLYGCRSAITFAQAIADFRIFDHPFRFAKAFMGRHVYGLKVFKPEEVGRIDITVQYV